jgi:proton glutamate symport protein
VVISILTKYLQKPWVILSAMIFGAAFGFYNPNLQQWFTSIGQMYITLLQMCVLPIIISAITSSLGNLLQAELAGKYFKKILSVFGVGLLFAAIIALLASILYAPGTHLNQLALGKHVAEMQKHFSLEHVALKSDSLFDLISNIIPDNIFNAITKGENLPVLFFFVLLGLALGVTKTESAKNTLKMIDSFQTALLKIISWILYFLPFGLFFLFAGFVGSLGQDILMALAKLITLFFLITLSIAIFYTAALWWLNPHKFLNTLKGLKTPLIIALATSSSYATMLPMLKFLQQDLKLSARVTDFVIPVGINIHQQGSLIRFIVIGVFMAQLYGHPLGIEQLALISFTALLASLAASGVPGIASISIIAVVLQPLGLPVLVGIILVTAIEPLVDPLITFINVYGNAIAALYVADYKRTQTNSPE